MPQLVPVVLTDREPTPVDHTFQPLNIDNGVATLRESSGVPIGDRRLTIEMSTRGSGRFKPMLKFTVPVTETETVNGVSKEVVTRTAYAEVRFNFDQTSTTQERKNLVGMVADALGADQTMIDAVVVDLESVY